MAWSDKATIGESGLADRFKFTVRSAKFAFPYDKAPGTCALVLDGERDIDGQIDDDHLWIKPGETFEPGDSEGTFALHTSQDPDKHFNKNSGLFKFLKSGFEIGLGEALQAAQDPDRAKYEEKDALMWVGFTLDIEMVEEEFTLKSGPEAGKVVQSRQPRIRGFVAPDGSSGASAAASGEASASTSEKASTNGTFSEEQAKELAVNTPKFMKYLETLVEEHGVDTGSPLAQKAFYEEARA